MSNYEKCNGCPYYFGEIDNRDVWRRRCSKQYEKEVRGVR